MERNIKTIGVLTSGGDAPGMNAAIRAVTRTARFHNMNVVGIMRGYQGLIEKEFVKFTSSSVSNTIQRGGTILKTARCMEFMTPEGRKKAYDNMVEAGIDALVVIGGNGSLTGAQLFAREYDIPIIGLPGTIDNDLDKIRDTANSHDRIFFIEVMGRDAGFLAQNSAIASGAEAAIIPEGKTDVDQLAEFIERGKRKSKNSAIVLVSESQKDGKGGANYYADRVKKEYPQLSSHVTILGHLQRGGTPSAYDRILASRLGYAAIEALLEGQRNVMIGIKNDEIVYVPISRAVKMNKPINQELISVLNVLSM